MTAIAAAQQVLTSSDYLNRGAQEYAANRYKEAQADYERAAALDPGNVKTVLYLGTAHVIQWLPGGTGPENKEHFAHAHAAFERALAIDPKNEPALASLARLAYDSAAAGSPEEKRAALEEARNWNLRRLDVDPADVEALYYVGVIDWAECFPQVQVARIEAKFSPDQVGPLPAGSAKDSLAASCAQQISESIDSLHRAIELDPENDDAMAYLNLSLRLKANVSASASEAASLVKEAEGWMDRSLETKRNKASRPNGTQ